MLYGGDVAWTQIGIRDLHHMHTKIKKHETSVKHVNNVIDLSFLGSVDIAQRLDTGHQLMIARHNEKVTQNELFYLRSLTVLSSVESMNYLLEGMMSLVLHLMLKYFVAY